MALKCNRTNSAAYYARPVKPDIPGVDARKVVMAEDILKGFRPAGKRMVIIGGGRVGCETAEFIAQSGGEVIILVRRDKVGRDIGSSTRWVVLQLLKKADVRIETNVPVTGITEQGVSVSRSGRADFFPADTVVIAAGMESCNRLFVALQGKLAGVQAIRDCVKPRGIAEAIEEGFRAGLLL